MNLTRKTAGDYSYTSLDEGDGKDVILGLTLPQGEGEVTYLTSFAALIANDITSNGSDYKTLPVNIFITEIAKSTAVKIKIIPAVIPTGYEFTPEERERYNITKQVFSESAAETLTEMLSGLIEAVDK